MAQRKIKTAATILLKAALILILSGTFLKRFHLLYSTEVSITGFLLLGILYPLRVMLKSKKDRIHWEKLLFIPLMSVYGIVYFISGKVNFILWVIAVVVALAWASTINRNELMDKHFRTQPVFSRLLFIAALLCLITARILRRGHITDLPYLSAAGLVLMACWICQSSLFSFDDETDRDAKLVKPMD